MRAELHINPVFAVIWLLVALVPQVSSATRVLPTDSAKIYMVYFDFDKYGITLEGESVLDRVKGFSDANYIVRIEITGHTDDAGSDAYNMDLGRRRALATRNHLKRLGVKKDLLIEVFGERKPAYDNSKEMGRRFNRRAEVKVYYRDPSLVSYRLHGLALDATTGRPVPAEFSIIGYRADTAHVRTPDGHFDLKLKHPKTITMTCFAEGFLFQTKSVSEDTFDLGDNNEIAVNFLLRRIEKGLKFDLRNIYFEGNKAVILPVSFPELETLTKMMQENPTLVIELRGHVNWPSGYPQPITFFAVKLSEQRAKTVFDYLSVNRIDPKRMAYQGMANMEMIFPNTTDEKEMALNRRVEVVVVDY